MSKDTTWSARSDDTSFCYDYLLVLHQKVELIQSAGGIPL